MLCSEGIALGPGKVDLLALIGETGSIRKAAERMGMSYMRAWTLIKTMNACFHEPLVVTLAGRKRTRRSGAHGDGTNGAKALSRIGSAKPESMCRHLATTSRIIGGLTSLLTQLLLRPLYLTQYIASILIPANAIAFRFSVLSVTGIHSH